ncbi:MAG: 16S rRNA (uracil(1498)-N(3))-methyltransferase [Alphaproteobacteria bacterium]
MRPAPPDRQRAALRLFVEAPLAVGATVALTPGQTHYLQTVMRRQDGNALLLFNGRDGEWRATLASARRDVSAKVVARTLPQAPAADLWLVFAPVKRAPLDFIARAATELGASALVPVLTRRTAVGRVNVERLRANAVEAAEQCGRLSVPECSTPARFNDVLADWPPERRLLVCDETGAGAPVAEALAGVRGEPGPWAVLTGPEGGFAADEVATLARVPQALRVNLGPRTLRAETAAVCALACLQALAGDWRSA